MHLKMVAVLCSREVLFEHRDNVPNDAFGAQYCRQTHDMSLNFGDRAVSEGTLLNMGSVLKKLGHGTVTSL